MLIWYWCFSLTHTLSPYTLPHRSSARLFLQVALPLVCFYIAVNMTFNIFVTLVIKHGSATLMYAAITVAVPIAYIVLLFYQSWTDNLHASPFTWPYFVGITGVVVGLTLYRSTGDEPGSVVESRELPSTATIENE